MGKRNPSTKTIHLLRIFSAIIISSLFISGCSNSGFLTDEKLTSESERSALIPQDSIYDIGRSDEDFAFESYVSVGLDLNLSIIDEEGEYSPGDDAVIMVAVKTLQDNELFRGIAAADGTIDGFFGISTSTDSLLLTIEGPGLERRVITIDNPAALSDIKRDLQVVSLKTGRALSADLADSDGDGVPDIYDAYPDDPSAAFEIAFPADGSKVFTIAFEDNFPNLGDGDYNDFVADYSLSVSTGRNEILFLINGEASAIAKVAGYDHEFGLMFRIPGFYGLLSTYLDGVPVIENQKVSNDIRIPLFSSTSAQVGSTATFSLSFDPEYARTATINDMDASPFDPYLYIKNTDYDVHLIGQVPLPGSQLTSDEDYRDADGFPRALLVPGNFAPPQELTSILDAYPRFQAWVDAEGGNDPDGLITSDWYFSPDPALVMDISSAP